MKKTMIFKKIAKKLLSKSPSLNTAVQTKKFELAHKQDFSNLEDYEKDLLIQVRDNGYAVVPEFLDIETCDACTKDMDWMFENKKEFLRESDFGDSRIFGAEELSKNIKKFGNNDLLNKLANAYYAVPACNGFTLAGKMITTGHEYGSGGSWHRDSYLRQFKSLIYLNDVTEENGPFQVLLNSHKSEQIKLDKKIASLDEMQSSFPHEIIQKIIDSDPSRLHTLTGKAGTMVLVDTSAIHRGAPLKSGIRYALTNYFFEKSQINPHLVEHFSPLVSPQKVLQMGNN
jgi:hypothetical protein